MTDQTETPENQRPAPPPGYHYAGDVNGFNWEPFYREDGTIDLQAAFLAHPSSKSMPERSLRICVSAFEHTQWLRAISSRQVAALAFQTAIALVADFDAMDIRVRALERNMSLLLAPVAGEG